MKYIPVFFTFILVLACGAVFVTQHEPIVRVVSFITGAISFIGLMIYMDNLQHLLRK